MEIRLYRRKRFFGKLSKLIEATKDVVHNCVKVFGELYSSFESCRKLATRSLLFNITLEGVMRRARLNSRGTKFVYILGQCT